MTRRGCLVIFEINCPQQAAEIFPERNMENMVLKPAGIFVTDFDGTLVRSDGTLAKRDLEELEALGERGVVRVLATGRSMYSLLRSKGKNLAVEYIVFSCGAGVFQSAGEQVIHQKSLSVSQVRHVIGVLDELRMDYMVHREIPDNHFFLYRRANSGNPDFERRLDLYRMFSEPLDGVEAPGTACQVLAVLPADGGADAFRQIRQRLLHLSVIRTTSPLDHTSIWVEMFAPGVSKGRTVAWLSDQLDVGSEKVMAVGNDYNDCDLLEWAGRGMVVANAPRDLKQRFAAVASNDDCGVAEAIFRCDVWG